MGINSAPAAGILAFIFCLLAANTCLGSTQEDESSVALRNDVEHALAISNMDDPSLKDLMRAQGTIAYLRGFYEATALGQMMKCPATFQGKAISADQVLVEVKKWFDTNEHALSTSKLFIIPLAIDADSMCPKQ